MQLKAGDLSLNVVETGSGEPALLFLQVAFLISVGPEFRSGMLVPIKLARPVPASRTAFRSGVEGQPVLYSIPE